MSLSKTRTFCVYCVQIFFCLVISVNFLTLFRHFKLFCLKIDVIFFTTTEANQWSSCGNNGKLHQLSRNLSIASRPKIIENHFQISDLEIFPHRKSENNEIFWISFFGSNFCSIFNSFWCAMKVRKNVRSIANYFASDFHPKLLGSGYLVKASQEKIKCKNELR